MMNEINDRNIQLLLTEKREKTLNYQVKNNKKRYIIALFLIGIFNNNGYVLVLAGSQSIAQQFK